jgi:uncharacterized protein YdeI (YjbR/CyaY-like superfamily)
MSGVPVSGGLVHELPEDLRAALLADGAVLAAWEGLTVLARNEWICWIDDAKRPETRRRRIARVPVDLAGGKRRPCCWPGCAHRELPSS